VHFCSTSLFGNYWSVTKYNDIVHVDTTAGIFSSDLNLGGVLLRESSQNISGRASSRWTSPGRPRSARLYCRCSPTHLDKLAILIRERSEDVLDKLPRNETFDWVERVSVELTTQIARDLVRLSV
jgi:cytochrome P450